MIAPSEKHLEDWIVANPRMFLDCITDVRGKSEICIVARQLRLPSGIADVILQINNRLVIVEAKKDKVNSQTLVQLLRYMRDFEHASLLSYYRMFGNEDSGFASSPLRPRRTGFISGALIGHSVAGEDVINACRSGETLGLNVGLVTYEYDDEQGYRLQSVSTPKPYDAYYEQLVEVLDNGLDEVFQGVYWNRLQRMGVRV